MKEKTNSIPDAEGQEFLFDVGDAVTPTSNIVVLPEPPKIRRRKIR